ncbi:MAG: hypothetical protein K2H43_04535 [Clostridia bacterium]|nr:hypothetical protein [Clostridia bacterium]
MKKFKFLAVLTAALLTAACVSGCGSNSGKPDPGPGPAVTDPALPERKEYVYEGTPTVAPYKVFNSDGTPAGAEDGYDSMFLALRYAGERALSSNPMYVEDATGLKIFQRQSNSQSWCYDGTNFVGTKNQKEALAWGAEHSRSYVLNGRGTEYIYLGSDDYTDERHPEDVYERGSGGYSYLFTPSGTAKSDEWLEYGYSYASGIVRLSEATYYDATYYDEDGKVHNQWNAYVFFNIRGTDNCDLGIGTYAGGNGAWKITQNCSNIEHKNGTDPTPSFYVYQDQVVTTMKKDPETGIYSGADDVFIEAIGGMGTWTLRVTNLRTGEVFGYTHTHEGMHEKAEGFFRTIVAASYCPVESPIWDARGGGYIKNIVFEDVKVARYNEKEEYPEEVKEELWYGLNTIKYGFTQGADTAHLTFGIHEADGAYKSGAEYKKGSKYMSFSSYYDGTHIED